MRLSTDQAINEMVDATLGDTGTPQKKHLLRESLRALVRMARAEQILEIKTSVATLIGKAEMLPKRKQKSNSVALNGKNQEQRQLEFTQKDMPLD